MSQRAQPSQAQRHLKGADRVVGGVSCAKRLVVIVRLSAERDDLLWQ